MSEALDLTELGTSGLRSFGGRISAEFLRRLEGEQGQKSFREMADNDPVVGGSLFAIEMLIRSIDWSTETWSQDPLQLRRAEYADSLRYDMSHTWEDMISEALSMLTYGWCSLEVVLKRRLGNHDDSRFRSRHFDGLVGVRKLPIRSQTTLDRWEIDDDGGINGWWQRDPNTGSITFLPIERLLHFRTSIRENNPEGRSALRTAFVPWFQKKRIEESEVIGIDRDLTGIPHMELPEWLFHADASAEHRAELTAYREMLERIRNDEQAFIITPAKFDADGNKLVTFNLVGSPGQKLHNTGEIVGRKDRAIAGTLLADFILLGHGLGGSRALSEDKTDLFSAAINGWVKSIAEIFNRHLLPRVWHLNGWDPAEAAWWVPGKPGDREIASFAAAVAQLTAAAQLTPGDRGTENAIRRIVGLPELEDELEIRTDPSEPGSADDGAGASESPDLEG